MTVIEVEDSNRRSSYKEGQKLGTWDRIRQQNKAETFMAQKGILQKIVMRIFHCIESSNAQDTPVPNKKTK